MLHSWCFVHAVKVGPSVRHPRASTYAGQFHSEAITLPLLLSYQPELVVCFHPSLPDQRHSIECCLLHAVATRYV